MERDSFIFRKSYYEAIVSFSEKAERRLMLNAIVERALYGKEPNLDGRLKTVYESILPQIEADEIRYIVRKGLYNGRA